MFASSLQVVNVAISDILACRQQCNGLYNITSSSVSILSIHRPKQSGIEPLLLFLLKLVNLCYFAPEPPIYQYEVANITAFASVQETHRP